MKEFNAMFMDLLTKLKSMAKNNAVVAKPISVGDKHVIPLCELRTGFGGGGGHGEGGSLNLKESLDSDAVGGKGHGQGQGVGGGASVTPVASIIVDGDDVTVKLFER